MRVRRGENSALFSSAIALGSISMVMERLAGRLRWTGQSKTWPQGVRGFLVSRRRLRVSPWTSPRLFVHVPEIFRLSSSPMCVYTYIYIYTRICIHTSTFAYRLCSARARALMYHLRRWTDVCIRVGIRLREGKAVPPVSVARVCYARPGMFPTKLTSPRLDALAQSGIESPSVAVTA